MEHRERILTEKGREYQIGLLQAKRRKLQETVLQTIESMEELLEGHKKDEIENLAGVLASQFEELLNVHARCQILLESEDRFQDDKAMDKVDRMVYNVKRRVRSLLSENSALNEKLPVAMSSPVPSKRSSRSSKSDLSRSTRSSRSSLMCKVKEEKAKLAELAIEQSFLRQRKEMELKSKQLEVEMEIAKATAKLKIYEEPEKILLENIPAERSYKKESVEEYVDIHRKTKSVYDNKSNYELKDEWPVLRSKDIDKIRSEEKEERPTFKYPSDKKVEEKYEKMKTAFASKSTNKVQENNLDQPSGNKMPQFKRTENDIQNSQFVDLLMHMQAPELEIDTFDGNPLNFLYFMTNFKEAIETKVKDERGRLTRLIQYLRGEAKELIQSCIYLQHDRCYQEAKSLLYQHYGDPHRILSEFKKEVKNWPKLKPNDSTSYKQFYSFLVKFRATMMYSGNEWFDSPELIQVLQSKLPLFMQDKWNRQAFKIRSKRKEEARLSDFIGMIEKEVQLVTDPLYSREATISEKEKNITSSAIKPKGRFKSFGVETSSKTCPCCTKKHDLDDCQEYLKKPLDKRRKFLFDKRLCFACYEPTSKDHFAKSCTRQRTCSYCQNKHPSGLHGYVESKQSIKSACANVKACVVSLCVVPVILSHKKSNKVIKTYALLDNGSQGSFIKEELLKEFNIPSIETSIAVTTVSGESKMRCDAVDGFQVTSIKSHSDVINLPRVYTQPLLPVQSSEVPTPKRIRKWKYLRKIQSDLPQDEEDIKVQILIGANCPGALEPLELIKSQSDGPYAFRTKLGWCVSGPIISKSSFTSKCNLIAAKDIVTNNLSKHHYSVKRPVEEDSCKNLLKQMYQLEFAEQSSVADFEFSLEDTRFLSLMNKEVKRVNGHYELPLPFRDTIEVIDTLPSNKEQVRKRMAGLKKRLINNTKMHTNYTEFMNNLLEKGFAQKASSKEDKTWFTPHFGVYHPAKPDKIRVVFNYSATFFNTTLNEHLIQGPDLTNDLLGVLMRFRQEEVAMMADVESMFHQVRIPDNQRRYLRFLWWPNGDINNELEEYEMAVHPFGAVSSPSCANYALKKTAEDHEKYFGKEAANTLKRSFYVDDMVKSVSTPTVGIDLLQSVIKMTAAGGFPLAKIISNSKMVLDSIPNASRAKSIKTLDLLSEPLPIERALGVHWCVESDRFGFKVSVKPTKETRRGILSSVASIYDPLGLAGPFILKGRQLLQELCADKKGWDESLSTEQSQKWKRWLTELEQLQEVSVPRCYKPTDFGEIVDTSIHHFCDASDVGYGTASFLRLKNFEGKVHCCLIIGKSRVAPLKVLTIPRMELTAATLAIKISKLLRRELELEYEEYYWTDSQVVLCYLKNERKRFKVFVANRISTIREHSKPEQWHYVPSSENPADDASRGLNIKRFVKNRRWFDGPSFLYKDKNSWPKYNSANINDDDLELTKVKVAAAKLESSNSFLQHLLKLTSRWHRLKRIVATVLYWRFKKEITIEELQDAERRIVRLVQQVNYKKEICDLLKSNCIDKSSSLRRLDPFLDKNQIICVGGRIRKSNLNKEIIHPIILPKNEVSAMIIRSCHEKVAHGGRGYTINEVRRTGYWIISCNSFVRHIISQCVICRSQRTRTAQQKMSDLPTDRIEQSPPFTNCGIDLFGPFIIREGRKELKKYGTIFTCLVSRAVHIESCNSLETDSFILALRRFVARRGHIRLLRCDNGSNFIGAEAELRKAWNEMDQEKVSTFLQHQGGDIIKWKRNPPKASHFGGIWERQIRSARVLLTSLLRTHGESLNDEAFRTVLTEVENIINSRPLTVDNLSDFGSPLPLSPMNLLTMKTNVVLPPPGEFQQCDLYCRRRWRRVQHISNEFWVRWQKEYLQSLQQRSKWYLTKRNFQVDDVVLIKEQDMVRNNWKLAKVTKIHEGDDGNVRSCDLITSTKQHLSRPIHKLVLLLESNRFPDEEPK